MESDKFEVLYNKDLYPIYSAITNHIHMDDKRRTILFDNVDNATRYVEKKNTAKKKAFFVGSAVQYTPENVQKYISRLYGQGATMIVLSIDAEDKPRIIPIDVQDVIPSQYNPVVMFNILKLKHTSERKYLSDLKNCMLIAAVKLTKRDFRGYPKVQYVFGAAPGEKNSKRYFFLFTTMKEFTAWNKTQNYAYEPCEVEIRRFEAIKKKNPVLINPISDQLVLTDKQLQDSLFTKRL